MIKSKHEKIWNRNLIDLINVSVSHFKLVVDITHK